jgi:hypothetical protein
MAGNLLALLPHRVVEAVVAGLFLLGTILMLHRRDNDSDLNGTGNGAPAADTARRPGPVLPPGAILVAVRWYLQYGLRTETSKSCWPSGASRATKSSLIRIPRDDLHGRDSEDNSGLPRSKPYVRCELRNSGPEGGLLRGLAWGGRDGG